MQYCTKSRLIFPQKNNLANQIIPHQIIALCGHIHASVKTYSTCRYGPSTGGRFWEALRAISPNYFCENCRQKAPHALREQRKDEVGHSKLQLIINMKMSTDKFLKAIWCLLSEFKMSPS